MTSTGVHKLTMEVKIYTATTQVESQKCHNWSQRVTWRGCIDCQKEARGDNRKWWEEDGKRLKVRNEAELVPYLWEGVKAWI